jgi:UDP-N-acetyl-D-galactosamine dehydrogenase
MYFSNNNIAIIGLGYVGLPLAVAFGSKYNTLGFDINTTRVSELSNGIDKTLESDSDKIKGATQLKFSSNPVDLNHCDIFIVTVPTPINQFKAPDLTPVSYTHLRAHETN